LLLLRRRRFRNLEGVGLGVRSADLSIGAESGGSGFGGGILELVSIVTGAGREGDITGGGTGGGRVIRSIVSRKEGTS